MNESNLYKFSPLIENEAEYPLIRPKVPICPPLSILMGKNSFVFGFPEWSKFCAHSVAIDLSVLMVKKQEASESKLLWILPENEICQQKR